MPSISLEETDEARGLIFLQGWPYCNTDWEFSNFDLKVEIQVTPRGTPGALKKLISKLLDQNSKIPSVAPVSVTIWPPFQKISPLASSVSSNEILGTKSPFSSSIS